LEDRGKRKGRKEVKLMRWLNFAAFFLFLFGIGESFLSTSRAVVDRIVAVVNQEIIMLSEVEHWMNPLLEGIQTEDRLERKERLQELRRNVLDRLIEEKLIDQEANRSGIKVTKKEIESALEEIKERNHVTQEELEKALAKDGLTLEAFTKRLEKEIQRLKILQSVVKIDVKPGEKELLDFYRNHIDRYRSPELYRPSHILFVVPKGASPEQVREARKRCQQVLERIRKGEDFGEMALLYSEDLSAKDHGDLGYFKKGELLPSFEREALRLKVGEVSGIVRTDFGFHIIKLMDRKGGAPLPFEEVKEKVRKDFYEKESEKAFKQFISNLREKSVIEIRL
jgi:parvulin-like peptidyl-prolyl isomerase